jgi:diguanylate cyclase (GGDEF)-like protein
MQRMIAEQRLAAVTDSLTGLRNRRYFEAHLEFDVARAARSGASLTFILLDLDQFKSVNDRFGHGAGDRVLCEVAGRLSAVTRAGDVLARYGGEEFAALIFGASLEEARATADRMRDSIGSRPFEVTPGVNIPDVVPLLVEVQRWPQRVQAAA